MATGVLGPASSPDDPTEADQEVARGTAYLTSGKASNPQNDAKTRGWLARIDKAVDGDKGRRK